jgi:hypothetical protein
MSWLETVDQVKVLVEPMTEERRHRVLTMAKAFTDTIIPSVTARAEDAEVVGFAMAPPHQCDPAVVAMAERFGKEDPAAAEAALRLIVAILEWGGEQDEMAATVV